jgi:type 1 glutamine amidotransferase
MKFVSPTFPGLEDLKSFDLVDEWYICNNTAPDLHVILVQDTGSMGKGGKREPAYNIPPYPATWARMEGKGRVFYTSMGHREDVCLNPIFQKVLIAGMNWACGKTQFDPKPNMQETCPPDAPVPPPAQ